jgi:hypothetical protein
MFRQFNGTCTFVTLFLIVCSFYGTAFATPQMEIDKSSCRYFYLPNNTYQINFSIEVHNTSTAGEILQNIQVNDNMATTFGSSRLVSANVNGLWGDNGDTTTAWNWNFTNFTNWDGSTVTNVFNNGTYNISSLQLLPNGYIHIELCAIVRADDMPTGIGSNNPWTNTATFVSAQTTTGTTLTSANLSNTYSSGITNNVTVYPKRNRSILTSGLQPSTNNPPVSLDGTYTFSYFISYKNHPNTVPNPDGPNGAATAIYSDFSFGADYQFYQIPIKSINVTKVYGNNTWVIGSGYNGGASVINGVPVTPQSDLINGGTLTVGEKALFRIDVVAGPTRTKRTAFSNHYTDFIDAGGITQALPSGTQDTLNDPYNQCNCYGPGVNLRSRSELNITKSVVSTTCVAGSSSLKDIEYQFVLSAPATNNVWVRNLNILDNLTTNACGSFQSVVAAPAIATASPALHTSYNGNTATGIFLPNFNDKLGPNQSITVRMRARYNSTSTCTPNQYNTADALGEHPSLVAPSITAISNSVLIPFSSINCCITNIEARDSAVCSGIAVNLGVLTENLDAGAGTIAYFSTLTNALNNTSPLGSVIVTPSTTTKYYIRKSFDGTCFDIDSTILKIDQPISLNLSVGGSNICVNGTSTLTVNPTNLTPDCTLQWQQETAGVWANIVGATGTTYTTAPLSASKNYRVIASCTSNQCADNCPP